jgi:hypothetical protein
MVHSVHKVTNCIQLQVMCDVLIFGKLPYSSITSPTLQPYAQYIFSHFLYPVCRTCFVVSCTILKENLAYFLKIVSALQGYYIRCIIVMYKIMYKIYNFCRITVFFTMIKTVLYFIFYTLQYILCNNLVKSWQFWASIEILPEDGTWHIEICRRDLVKDRYMYKNIMCLGLEYWRDDWYTNMHGIEIFTCHIQRTVGPGGTG